MVTIKENQINQIFDYLEKCEHLADEFGKHLECFEISQLKKLISWTKQEVVEVAVLKNAELENYNEEF